MFSFFLRSVWRLIILAIGASFIYLTVEVFPYVDGRLPLFFVLLIVYCLFAYLIIPALFRLYHVIVKHDHIPLYVTTPDGWASDPVNLAIICRDKAQLQQAMSDAGWYEAEPATLKNAIREGQSILFNTAYPAAPVSTLYLFNRKHDIAFQLPTNDKLSARTRHHVRFWRLEEPQPEKHDHNHFDFWSKKLFKWFHPEREIWIGACTEDFSPIGIRWRTGTITHGVSHESDKERDFIVQTLRKSGKLAGKTYVSEAGDELRFRGQQFRTFYVSDGSIKIVRLK
ncbi:MAG: hypothetical protein EOO17_01635 [Chloroflexi bacterium]|nr:MAG: hypothetical protein EOO17_01635 [Chloroflexota bacterium]